MNLFNIYDSSNKPLVKGVPSYLIVSGKIALPENVDLESCIFTQTVRQFNTLKEVPSSLSYIKQLAEEIGTDSGVAAVYDVSEDKAKEYMKLVHQ